MFPDTRTDDIGSYRIHYARPHKKDPAFIIVSMHLDTYEGIPNGGGSFQKQTPQGKVLVKWHREWVTLEKTENGQPVDPENAQFPVYSVIIDSPPSLPVHLETQQYDLLAVRLNGHGLSVKPHLQGDVDIHGPYDATHFAYTFPGGHNAVALRAYYFRNE